ncbi:hypothetical protein KCU98_g16768, partial [Aureobasidium melanogenum]
MFAEIANYANDAAAVEKSLRLLQALVQIAAGTTASAADAKTWNMARGQFALARRYLRLFKWIDFGQSTQQAFASSEPDPSRRMLKTVKNALLALYFFMEMFCITNAMNITNSSFLVSLQHHALQIWFFAISVSFVLTSYELLCFSTSSATKPQLYTNLVIDCCDILIPGSAVNWIPVSSVAVGVASSISSLIVGKQIWERVQTEAQLKEQRKRDKAARKVRFDAGTKASEDEKEEVEKSEDKRGGSNGVVNGSVKALVNAVGDGNGSVKKRSKQA